MMEQVREIAVAPLSDVPPGEGRLFDIQGQPVAVFHSRNGEVFATESQCPHKAGPLVDGLLGDAVLICPLHNWKFDLRSGEPLLGSCSIRTFRTRLDEQERIVVSLPA